MQRTLAAARLGKGSEFRALQQMAQEGVGDEELAVRRGVQQAPAAAGPVVSPTAHREAETAKAHRG